MKFIIYILSFILILLIIFLIKKQKELNKKQQIDKEELNKYITEKEQLKEENQWYKDNIQLNKRENYDLEVQKSKLQSEVNNLSSKSHTISSEIEIKQNWYNSLKAQKLEDLEEEMQARKALLTTQVQSEIDDWAKSAQEAANFVAEYNYQVYLEKSREYNTELAQVKSQLNSYKESLAAANAEILRQREIEEHKDFYRVQLPDTTKHDLQLLNSIKPNLSKFDIFDKLIYDAYIKKPVDEMIKRVLKGGAPSGIYKITRLKTGEVYIGKSTDIKLRWQQHSKSAFHCGSISHSILHTKMEEDGIDQFTFELLEEVPKDQLSEKEKYWIEYYNSTVYGLNQRIG